MQMKPLFVLTSAINTKFGVYSPEQRFQQTLESIDSIKKRAPGAKIAILEMSGDPISDEQAEVLKKHINYLLTFSQEDAVKSIYNSTENWDIVKNCTEMLIFANALRELKDKGVIGQFDRIFKLTGRYQVTDNFNPDYYDTVPDRIVILKAKPSQFPPQVTGGLTMQYMSRFFSWPADQTDTIIDTYNTGFMAVAQHLNAGGYFDLEHMLYNFLPKDRVTEVDVLGCTGNLGPNGMQVND